MATDEHDDPDREERGGGLEPSAVGLRIRPGRGMRPSRSRAPRRDRPRPMEPAGTSAALLRVATAAAAGESASDVLALAVAEAQRLLGATAVLVVCDEEGGVVAAAGPGAGDALGDGHRPSPWAAAGRKSMTPAARGVSRSPETVTPGDPSTSAPRC